MGVMQLCSSDSKQRRWVSGAIDLSLELNLGHIIFYVLEIVVSTNRPKQS